MSRPRQHTPLRVLLNNQLVGLLLKEPSGAIQFRYDAGWLAKNNAIPVSFSLPCGKTRIEVNASSPFLKLIAGLRTAAAARRGKSRGKGNRRLQPAYRNWTGLRGSAAIYS